MPLPHCSKGRMMEPKDRFRTQAAVDWIRQAGFQPRPYLADLAACRRAGPCLALDLLPALAWGRSTSVRREDASLLNQAPPFGVAGREVNLPQQVEDPHVAIGIELDGLGLDVRGQLLLR